MFEVPWVEGVVRWSSMRRRIGANRIGDQTGIHWLESKDYVFLKTHVFPIGSTFFVRNTKKMVRRARQESEGRLFAQAAPPSVEANGIVAQVGVHRRLLKKLQGGEEGAPPEIALAALTVLIDDVPEMVGIHWSDGTRDLEVIVKDGWLYCIDLKGVEAWRPLLPWFDFSGGRSVRPLQESRLDHPFESVGIPPAELLAAGGALASLRGGGTFVNPSPKPKKLANGQYALTLPNPSCQFE